MKHIFIINPAAGKGVIQEKLENDIINITEENSVDCEIIKTESIGDAENIVRSICSKNNGIPLRFYACGGDGTINEVINGISGFENAEFAVIPIGTGNDFVKNFGDLSCFLDVEAQIKGESVYIDSVKLNDRYAVNVINMGFDCAVVERVAKIKRSRWISSSCAYIAGVFVELVKMPYVKLKKLILDGKNIEKTDMLLCAIANGGFYGGGFNAAPRARVDDGIIDVFYAERLSRPQFISIVGSYKNGTYVDNKRIMNKKVFYHKCKSVDIDFDYETSICIDGEISKMKSLHIEVVSDALKFNIPKGVSYSGKSAKTVESVLV